ncbi:hypothetical protein ACFQ0K_02265 [Nocardioides caeni]|uniref:Uncharacterized protein n=1 Tax=Nocardioides caeni TaxID=574700 RepID=A0A4S8NSU2_9ACTN|nr:hypothetical protein [Nocardioides caeni]THV18339.1 hypothetical protein E9934_01500 [Nocardioides caeni]
MSALATEQVTGGPRTSTAGSRLSPELEAVIIEIARSERALDDVLARSERLHQANIHHLPASCLVCFSSR